MISPLPLTGLVLIGVAAPALLLAALGLTTLVNRPLPERWTAMLSAGAMTLACAALLAAFAVHGVTGTGAKLLSYGAWSTSREGGIAIEFLVDRLSLAFAVLSTAITGVVSAFSNRYLHRESGYNRYFVLLAMFATGMLLIALAGNVAVLFIGWEFVGLSSALLVGFFHERPAPVANAFRVLAVYRMSDAAMLAAAVLLRHAAGTDSLALLFGRGADSASGLAGTTALSIAILLIVAVAAKSALLPFSSWLPRAMEGPTPSSAVYYGSLSIHAGCVLLLRAAPLLEQVPLARLLAGVLGAATAVYAGITTRVQSDVKSSLAYASLTQVGIIVVEIAIGWYTVAFVHLAGHACFRLLQFLSAPNVLHDLHGIESAVGEIRPSGGHLEASIPPRSRRRLFLIALERGFLDDFLDRVVVRPFTQLARRLTRLDELLVGAALPTRVARLRQRRGSR
ncbi:MAG TPA: proton-conducting transporter membrane subunit [Candidatus Eisenbacteria bacterium]|nr:proton-conducting transporter membrane subunit [Candidatus Eisenbacteria bacterium]